MRTRLAASLPLFGEDFLIGLGSFHDDEVGDFPRVRGLLTTISAPRRIRRAGFVAAPAAVPGHFNRKLGRLPGQHMKPPQGADSNEYSSKWS
jgi:hypothetical protein